MKSFNSHCIAVLWTACLLINLGNLSQTEAQDEEQQGNQVLAESHEFCYEDPKCDPTTWPGICQTGSNQSPVDIPYSHTDHVRANKRADLFQSPSYFDKQMFNLTNNGHTVQASLRDDLTSTSFLDGSLLGGQYTFSQLHFHWGSSDDRGSEHTLNRKQYPIEAHLVHYASEYDSFSAAMSSNKYGAVAVVGVLFEIAPRDNAALTPIIDAMRTMARTGQTKTGGTQLDLSWYLFQSRRQEVDVIQYYGSLTTPTCNEGVLWNVVAYPAPISARQMKVFRTMVFDKEGKNIVHNYRPTQNLNTRNLLPLRSSIQ